MSHVFPRHCHVTLPTTVAGDGCYLIDKDGKRYFDGSGGAAVSCLGHSNARVIKAIQDQAGKLAFAHTGFFTTEPAEALADLLIENAPGDLDRVYLVSGGSEAVESAIKLARQYFVELGQPERRHIIARRQSYHGNTLGALSAGGNALRREKFAPMLVEMSHIAPCYEYAERPNDESLEAYGQRVANDLETEIQRLGPESVIAFMAEPVVGATLGAVPAVPGYFKRVREICDQHGILLILDEVMCGMGRTGHLFAHEAEDIKADIVCIAKGLGAGYQPIGAMLCTSHIYDTIKNGSGFFQHGHTYLGHPIAAAAGVAVVREMLDNNLINQVKLRGKFLANALEAKFGDHPNIGDLRGRGLFRGIEIVADKKTKTPFSPGLAISAKFKKAVLAEGLICYPGSGTRDGKHGDHILLAPPFIATEEQLTEMVEMLSRALEATLPK
ncbi:aspartate aminotransferase family protein [Marinomonas colpomeniae]|uniref:Aspartate aminotransferase family protein n=1 Tax=Marinomonas colpomeniae TaxID=2774408 RepID=A0ABR8NTT9_9GAMM|nr:aspartate aminotransferase family protein [Marinomonas colpomeniae]MBD5769474.1 aspartate aminotransferase family protein [Marinomonas colpomeniae]